MNRSDAARRYAAWIEKYRWPIVLGSIALAAVAGVIASTIAIRADFSYLLPQSARSVEDLRAIEKRARVIGTAMIAVESDHPDSRRRAAIMMRDRALALGPGMVASITFDQRVERQYAWDNRWLFADLKDLEAARDALKTQIDQAKLAANPLFVSLDDTPPDTKAADSLRGKLADAEAKSKDPGELISKNGRVQMMIVHTGFSTGDVDKDRELLGKLDALGGQVHAELPDVQVGVAGDVPVSVAEHDAILSGMLRATLVTVALVMIALVWYFRSALAIGALSWSLTVGTLVTFAFAKLTLGYLNAATAFLSSIVIGNGINVGILVTARYLEELRHGTSPSDALAASIETTIEGTFTAALTAAVAYASLVITIFRGFRHFGIIGGVGILVCWISGYVVLPAALAVARNVIRPGTARPASWLGRLLPRRLGLVAGVALTLTAAAGAIAVRFLLGDPFESNFRNLRSQSADIARAQKWMTTIDQSFGQGLDAGFVIAAPARADVAPLEATLRQADAGKPENQKLFASLTSIDDVLPKAQPQKLAVLAQIRELLSGKDFDALDDKEKADAMKLRPPDNLRVLAPDDVPDAVAWPFVESDGTRGKLILATSGKGYEVWDTRDTMRWAKSVRALGLPDDVQLGGASFVFADVIAGVLSDGPRATLAAALGAILVVLLVIGANRFAFVTIACGFAGTLLMLGVSASAGLKVNFLDFVALPITIGIGIEYAVNIITRARQESDVGVEQGRHVLASTGGAVVLCSFTTTVGYGSLLLSQNLGIRSFGIAAMLGEITCLVMALYLAPSLLWLVRSRSSK
ncbi:MAG TPA: MMPL family transporter [Kofleriaceae bacterium]|nr:MMPL family transporter [Kofleriaceae bacterium]